MSDGKEILAAPYSVYLGPTGTPWPTVDDEEDDFDIAWVLAGTNGNKNITDAGVVININETISEFTGVGSTMPVAAWRTQEAVTVNFTLADMSIAQLAMVLDDAIVATVAAGTATPGSKSISLFRGSQVQKYALLARGVSPENPLLFAQYQLPFVFQAANQAPAYVKGTPAELACQFTVLEDLVNGLPGTYIAGTAPRSGSAP